MGPQRWDHGWENEGSQRGKNAARGEILRALDDLIQRAEEISRRLTDGIDVQVPIGPRGLPPSGYRTENREYVVFTGDLNKLRDEARYILADIGDPVRGLLPRVSKLRFEPGSGKPKSLSELITCLRQARDCIESGRSFVTRSVDKKRAQPFRTPESAKPVEKLKTKDQERRSQRPRRGTASGTKSGAGAKVSRPEGIPKPAVARARTIARLMKELNELKPQMDSENEYGRLAKSHPEFLCFRIAEKHPKLRVTLENLQAHRQHVRLALELAAAQHGVTLETSRTDWRDYKPPEFRKR